MGINNVLIQYGAPKRLRTSEGAYTIDLPISMANTDYFCIVNCYWTTNFSVAANCFDFLVYDKKVSSFKCYTAGSENRQNKGWFVIGPC